MSIFESREDKQFRKEIQHRQEENAISFAGKVLEQNTLAVDSQISAKILELRNRFLDWRIDGKKIWCAEKYPLKEPYLDEAVSFVGEGEPEAVVQDIESVLADIYTLIHKYEDDDETCAALTYEFNSAVMARQNLIVNSRITGKPVKVAKSYYVKSEANIIRDDNQKRNEQQQGQGFTKW